MTARPGSSIGSGPASFSSTFTTSSTALSTTSTQFTTPDDEKIETYAEISAAKAAAEAASAETTAAAVDTADQDRHPTFLRAFHPYAPTTPIVSTDYRKPSVTVPISTGDLILVHSVHPNGWADGSVLPAGARGWLPTNYCDKYPAHPAIAPLLTALAFVWEAVGAATAGPSAPPTAAATASEIFGADSYVRSFIRAVRCFLEVTGTVSRESDLVVRHLTVRSARNDLLSALTAFVRLSRHVRAAIENPARESRPLELDEAVSLLLRDLAVHAASVLLRAVSFMDLWLAGFPEPDIDTETETAAEITSIQEEYDSTTPALLPLALTTTTIPLVGLDLSPRPRPSLALSMEDEEDESTWSVPPTPDTAAFTMDSSVANTPSSLASSLKQKLSLQARRHRRRPRSPPAAAAARLAACHDAFLGSLGSFIGGHLQSRSPAELVAATEQSVAAGRQLIGVVEAIASARRVSMLEQACETLDARLVDLVQATRHLFTLSEGGSSGTIPDLPDGGRRLVKAATGCVRAAGEAVGRARSVVERVGDFELRLGSGRPTPATSAISTPLNVSVPHTPTKNAFPRTPIMDIPLSQPSRVVPLHAIPTRWRPNADREAVGLGLSVQSVSSNTDVGEFTPAESIMSVSDVSAPSELGTVEEDETESESAGDSVRMDGLDDPTEVPLNADEPKDEDKTVISLPAPPSYTHELLIHNNSVVAGSVRALVEHLTSHKGTPDNLFVNTFFLTFRSFMSPAELASEFIERWTAVGDSREFGLPIRLRVYNMLKAWLETHWNSKTDADALEPISEFALGPLMTALPSAAKRLVESTILLSQPGVEAMPSCAARAAPAALRRNTSSTSVTSLGSSLNLPQVMLPPPPRAQVSAMRALASKKLPSAIVDIDPLEVARHLTIITSALFNGITPHELLELKWTKNPEEAPNVKGMTAISNQLSTFVSASILGPDEPRRRANVIKYWIKVAVKFVEFSNFDSLFHVMCAINSPVITRLRRTWSYISSRLVGKFEDMKEIISANKNFARLRGAVLGKSAPCIPFLGIFLTDLTFVEEGNVKTRAIGDCQAINFSRYTKIGSLIRQIGRSQGPFPFVAVPELQCWLADQLEQATSVIDSEGNVVQDPTGATKALYVRSSQVEPSPASSSNSGSAPLPVPEPPAANASGAMLSVVLPPLSVSTTPLSPGISTPGLLTPLTPAVPDDAFGPVTGSKGPVRPSMPASTRSLEFLGRLGLMGSRTELGNR